MRNLSARLCVVLLVFTACGGGSGVESSNAVSNREDRSTKRVKRSSGKRVTVMTRNMDAGTDLGPVILATSIEELLKATAETYAEVLASGIPERAAAIADEIATQAPDLVALQEVTIWLTGGFLQPPAKEVLFDQLALLLAELRKRGAEYTPVIVQPLSDAEAPVPAGFDLRIIDQDVILARADGGMRLSNAEAHVYAAEVVLGSPVLGTVSVPRSFTTVDVTLGESSFRFVNTHLESFVPAVQVAQVKELIAALGRSPLPVLLAGDFNSNAEPGPDHFETVDDLLDAGYVDTWRATHPDDPGLTWPLHAEDPFTPISSPTERIDLIFARGPRVLSTRRIGAQLHDRTPSGLWPSDHAGVVASLLLSGDDEAEPD
jgi:endonuclease/exonuclease/phosphatase family metal-dependent hydrolase